MSHLASNFRLRKNTWHKCQKICAQPPTPLHYHRYLSKLFKSYLEWLELKLRLSLWHSKYLCDLLNAIMGGCKGISAECQDILISLKCNFHNNISLIRVVSAYFANMLLTSNLLIWIIILIAPHTHWLNYFEGFLTYVMQIKTKSPASWRSLDLGTDNGTSPTTTLEQGSVNNQNIATKQLFVPFISTKVLL